MDNTARNAAKQVDLAHSAAYSWFTEGFNTKDSVGASSGPATPMCSATLSSRSSAFRLANQKTSREHRIKMFLSLYWCQCATRAVRWSEP